MCLVFHFILFFRHTASSTFFFKRIIFSFSIALYGYHQGRRQGGQLPPPPMILFIYLFFFLFFFFYIYIFFFLLVSLAVGHGHDNTLPYMYIMIFFLKNFWSRKKCRSHPPPPPPRWATFFRAGAQKKLARETFAPPKQTPWRRPCYHVIKTFKHIFKIRVWFSAP